MATRILTTAVEHVARKHGVAAYYKDVNSVYVLLTHHVANGTELLLHPVELDCLIFAHG
jgi:hypothetical protein